MSHVKTILLSGFDPEGEPEIQIMSDGSLHLVFNFMPPSDFQETDDSKRFDNFDQQLEAALGIPVLWDDREIFIISAPKTDTVEKLEQFIQGYRAAHP
jgi:hypothetical protein